MKNQTTKKTAWLLAIVFVSGLAMSACKHSDEHPKGEHPKKEHPKKEQPAASNTNAAPANP